ncbi:helix-turn-helix domain-containing protein [Phocaeicola sp.]
MEQKIGNISIALIRKLTPSAKGIGNDFILDRTIHYIPDDLHPIFKYPLRLDGIIISVRKQGVANVNINLREHSAGPNDLVICAPGDILQSTPEEGAHQSQTILISSEYLKEMYINLNSFMPFFVSLKENPVFHLTEEEAKELEAFFLLIEEMVDKDDIFRTEIVRRLLGGYLYKIGSILHRRHPEPGNESIKSLKREEVVFNQFINLVTEHHCKERRVDFYAELLYLSPKHFSTVVKKVSGKTAGEWIDEYVILEAKALLKYSAMSIQEVAYHLNFPNPSFFGKYFKHHTGVSPSEYKVQ